MATLNGNDYYLLVDSVDMSAYVTSVSLSRTRGDENTTAGAGTEWEEHASKLSVCDISFTLAFDSTSSGDYLDHISSADPIAIIYGPRGSTAGMQKHDQDFLLTAQSGPEQNVEKTMVKIEVTGKSTGAPRTDLYANGTF